jgi:hypothetical protein
LAARFAMIENRGFSATFATRRAAVAAARAAPAAAAAAATA